MTKTIEDIKNLNKFCLTLKTSEEVKRGINSLFIKLSELQPGLNADFNIYSNAVAMKELNKILTHTRRIVKKISNAQEVNPGYLEPSGNVAALSMSVLAQFGVRIGNNLTAPMHQRTLV